MDLVRNFGDEQARHRRAAGLTQEQLAKRMGYVVRTIQHAEQGIRTPTLEYGEKADTALGLNGVMLNLAKQCRADPSPFGSFLAHERRAPQIRNYSPNVVHGLLQTKDYARAVMRATAPDSDLNEGVALRLERQEVLSRSNPPRLHVVIDESVLWRPIGGDAVQAAQLARLLDTPPNIIIQVLPLMAGEHAGNDGGLTILDFDDGEPSVVNVSSWGLSAIKDSVAEVKRAVAAFEMLTAEAMSPANSAAMITDLMEYFADDDV